MTDKYSNLKLKFHAGSSVALHLFRNVNINSNFTINPRVQGKFSTRISLDLYFSQIFTEC